MLQPIDQIGLLLRILPFFETGDKIGKNLVQVFGKRILWPSPFGQDGPLGMELMGAGRTDASRPDLLDLDEGIPLAEDFKVALVSLVLVQPGNRQPA